MEMKALISPDCRRAVDSVIERSSDELEKLRFQQPVADLFQKP